MTLTFRLGLGVATEATCRPGAARIVGQCEAIYLATVWDEAVRATYLAYRSSGGWVAASVGIRAHADCDVPQPSESRQPPLMVSR